MSGDEPPEVVLQPRNVEIGKLVFECAAKRLPFDELVAEVARRGYATGSLYEMVRAAEGELAKQLRDEAMARVLAGEREAWKARLRELVTKYVPIGWYGLWEDLRIWATEQCKLPLPRKPQSWGAMVNRFMDEGLLERVDELGFPRDPKSHGSGKLMVRRINGTPKPKKPKKHRGGVAQG